MKNKNNPSRNDICCFNCGLARHKTINFNNEEKGPHCFQFSQFGHKSFLCVKSKNAKPTNDQSLVNVINTQNFILKSVKFVLWN